MKILILANDDVGLYRFRKKLIEELKIRGNDIYISLPDGDRIRDLEDIGCKFIETPMNRRGMNPFQDLGLMKRYKEMIKTLYPDFIITYTIKPNIYGGIVASKYNIPYAMNITGLGAMFQKDNILKKMVIKLYKMACKKVKVVFFENTGNQKVFVNNAIVKLEKTCKLNGAGVDVEEFAMQKYPESDAIVRFLYLGRVMKEKGIDDVLDAFLKLREKYNVELDIVGPYEEGYGNRIERLHEQGVVKYHGFQKDVKTFIKNCHCLVFPSYYMEGMANVLLECGCMGRPLITADNDGCRESVNGKNGYVVGCQNVPELYESMENFVKLPYEEKVKMGEESHKYIVSEFSKEKVVKETIQRMME